MFVDMEDKKQKIQDKQQFRPKSYSLRCLKIEDIPFISKLNCN